MKYDDCTESCYAMPECVVCHMAVVLSLAEDCDDFEEQEP